MKNIVKVTIVFSFILLSAIGAVAQHLNKDSIAVLKRTKEVLREEAKLNTLKLKAAQETLDLEEMMKEAELLNEKAAMASQLAKKHSANLSNGEVGDKKLSSEASRSAKEASRNVDKAVKQSGKIAKSKKYIARLNENIRKLSLKIEGMKK